MIEQFIREWWPLAFAIAAFVGGQAVTVKVLGVKIDALKEQVSRQNGSIKCLNDWKEEHVEKFHARKGR